MEGKISRINNTTDLVVDRISSLPDSILGLILSFLATEEAVSTSILSKRWKFAWVNVHNLGFCYPEVLNEAENMKFVRFVNKVLLLHEGGSLDKFGLVWHACFSSHAIWWINAAITRNVRTLYLHLGVSNVLDIPVSCFNCDSLQYLWVENLNFINDATAVCLPRLEHLKLNGVSFKTKEACEKLISGSPMLHDLTCYGTGGKNADDDDDFTFIISSASLIWIEIFLRDRNRMKLKTPSLDYLRLVGSISEIVVEKSLSSLAQVDFQIDLDEHDFPENSIVEAVQAFDCATYLRFPGDVMRALSRATISLSTEFKRLVKLEAGRFCSSIQDLIQSSENLEDILIYQDRWRFTSDPSNWTDLVEVPRCLSKSLKKVHYSGYNGLEDEHEMIRYMLEHGSVLEEMVISCYSDEDGEKIKLLQEICEFPRKSPVCKVKFYA